MSEFNITNFEAVALDFDGTLTMGEHHTEARLEAYKKMSELKNDSRYANIDPAIHAEAHLHGSTPTAINTWLMAEAGLIEDPEEVDSETVEAVVELKKQIYRDLIAKGQEASPGAVNLIRRASVRLPGKLGIVTAAHAWEVSPFLTRYKLNPYFPASRIVSVEDLTTTANSKPHPEGYITFMGRVSISQPEKLLIVEDSLGGIISGKRAGAVVAAVAGTHTRAELMDLEGSFEPDLIVENLDELNGLLGFSSK